MTLILTALCRNGISICSDKRSKRIFDSGKIEYSDNLNKTYSFDDVNVAICNHGVNEIQGKSWKVFCSDYDKSNRWEKKNLFQIFNDFKEFLTEDVEGQLKDNFKHGRISFTGFIVSGKTNMDTKFKINEIAWKFDSGGIHSVIKRHWGLVKTGVAEKYLENYINVHSDLDTIDYWKRMNTFQAEEELKKLFIIAVEEGKRLDKEKKISDKCDVVSIT